MIDSMENYTWENFWLHSAPAREGGKKALNKEKQEEEEESEIINNGDVHWQEQKHSKYAQW